MNPNLRTLECLERVLQKTIPRNTAPFLRKVDLKKVTFSTRTCSIRWDNVGLVCRVTYQEEEEPEEPQTVSLHVHGCDRLPQQTRGPFQRCLCGMNHKKYVSFGYRSPPSTHMTRYQCARSMYNHVTILS